MKEKGFVFYLMIIVFPNFYNQLNSQTILDTLLFDNVHNYDMIKCSSQGYFINWIDLGEERNVFNIKLNEQFEVIDSVKMTNIAGTYGRTAIDERAGNIASAWLHLGINFDIADVVGGAVVNSEGKLSTDLFFNYGSGNIESRFSQDLVFLTDTSFLVTWVDYFGEGSTRISCKIINVNKPDSNHFLPDLVLSDSSSSSVIWDLCTKLNKKGNSFIISWSGVIEETTKIFYKTFDFNLNLLSSKSEIISNQILDLNSNFNADLLPLESGGFLSLYFKPEETNKYNLYLSEYNAELELTYNEMINDSATMIKDANMSMNDEGKIIVSWANIKGNTNSIHGQRFNSNLENIEGNFTIAESKEKFERIFSPITLLNNQQIITSYIYGTEPYSLKLKVLDFDSPTVINFEISKLSKSF